MDKESTHQMDRRSIKSKTSKNTSSVEAMLSAREFEIATYYAQGQTSKEIAEMLFVAHTTVRTHVASIYRKLEIRNKAELIILFRKSVLNESPMAGKSIAQPILELPDLPSIAVLPFSNMSSDSDQEYFCDGMSEDLITELSKLPELLVIARNSTFVYKGRQVDVRQVSHELGVRYVLEGSVRKSGSHIRISTQLVDGKTGSHLWAERYDRELKDVFSVQDEVTQKIVASLVPELSSQILSGRIQPTQDIVAYDYYLRGRQFGLMDTEQAHTQAHVLLKKAIALDSCFSLAYAHLARNHVIGYLNRWGNTPEKSLRLAIDLGEKAIVLDDSNSFAHFAVATAVVWNRQLGRAELEARKAIALDPNFADAHAAFGMIMIYAGRPLESILPIETAMRIDPHYRDIFLHLLGLSYFHIRDYEKAKDVLKRRLIRKPESDISRELLASAYGHLGDIKRCQSIWDELIRLNSEFSIERRRKVLPYKNASDFEHIVDGLRKAGIRLA